MKKKYMVWFVSGDIALVHADNVVDAILLARERHHPQWEVHSVYWMDLCTRRV